MSGINMPARKDKAGLLETLVAGVRMARDIQGMDVDEAQVKRLEAEAEAAKAESAREAENEAATKAERERFNSGKLTKREQIELGAKGYVPATAGQTPDFTATDAETGGVLGYVKKQTAPVIKPDYRTVGKDLVQVNPDGTTKVVHSGRAAGGGPTTSKRKTMTMGNKIVEQQPDGSWTPVFTDESKTAVPGLEPVPGYTPTTKDAETVKRAKEVYENLTGSLSRLDKLYAGSRTNLVGEDAAAQGALVTDIQLNLKELQNLGVLNGPDLELLMKQVPDPTSLAENLKGMLGSDRYGVKAKEFRTTLDQRFENTLKARGFSRGLPGDDGMVTVTNGKETLKIPRQDLEAATKDGFSAVGNTAGVSK